MYSSCNFACAQYPEAYIYDQTSSHYMQFIALLLHCMHVLPYAYRKRYKKVYQRMAVLVCIIMCTTYTVVYLCNERATLLYSVSRVI